jgi:hypothetical protein|tara:strand:+ start:3629 stop:4258 length:630 start_codon:yes stop_codon:yes gene_type:complete
MKSKRLIEQRIEHEIDPLILKTLLWVLESPECPFCAHPQQADLEMKIHRDEMTPSFLETKMNWPMGTVDEHMNDHIQYDPVEAQHIEKMRKESISTLNVAEDLVQRLISWVDELEQRKATEGLTSEWIADATKLLGQGQGFLKLIGTLKKEIGVDSQLLLADRKVDAIMGILVDTLRNEPVYLDQIQLRLAALKAPDHVIDADFEEVGE